MGDGTRADLHRAVGSACTWQGLVGGWLGAAGKQQCEILGYCTYISDTVSNIIGKALAKTREQGLLLMAPRKIKSLLVLCLLILAARIHLKCKGMDQCIDKPVFCFYNI